MPSKADQPAPVPTDLPGILETLGTSDDHERLAATLGVLFTLDAGSMPKDQSEAQTLVERVQPLAGHSEGSVRGAAVKVLAKLACLTSPARELVLTEAVAKSAWAALADLSAVWPTYQAAVAQVMASGGFPKPDSLAGGKKQPASTGKAASLALDPESTLPGPTKQTLDAALRVLCTLATTASSDVASASGVQQSPLAWLVEGAEVAEETDRLRPLVRLLSHHSPRVQYRAAQVAGVLAGKGVEFIGALVAAGAAGGLLQLVTASTSGSVRLVAIQALQSLAGTVSAAHTQLLESGAVPALLLLVSGSTATGLDPAPVTTENPPATASTTRPGTPEKAGKGGAAPQVPEPGQMDFARPFPSKPADLQAAAMKALITLSHFSQGATEQIVRGGGLQLLQALLPAPTAAAGALAAAAAPTSTANSTPPTNGPAPSSGAQSLDNVAEGEQLAAEQPAETVSEPPQEYQPWLECLTCPALPCQPLPSQETQVLALRLLTQLLSIPGIQAALHHQLQAQHVVPAPEIASPAPPTEPAVPFSPSYHPLHQLLHLFAGAPALPPVPAPEALGKNGKPEPKAKPAGKGKAEDVGPPPLAAHMLPPFAAAVRGAALQALTQLARHRPTAEHLSAHSEVVRIIRQCGAPSEVDLGTAQPDSPEVRHELAEGVALLSEALTVNATEEPEQCDGLTRISQANLVATAKKLASLAVQPQQDYLIRSAVHSMVLALPETEFVAPARPPLPSPPPTPPPLPLATSMFLWDALDRPMMADGKAKLDYM